MTDYARMLNEGWADVRSRDGEVSRLDYLGDHIFNFTTYDSEMSELFAKKALEVCAAISDRTTFDYIKDPDNYRWFLLMLNIPFFADRTCWGTSVRGAWWDTNRYEKPGRIIAFTTCGLVLDGEQITDFEFTTEEWEKFIAAVIAFAGSP